MINLDCLFIKQIEERRLWHMSDIFCLETRVSARKNFGNRVVYSNNETPRNTLEFE